MVGRSTGLLVGKAVAVLGIIILASCTCLCRRCAICPEPSRRAAPAHGGRRARGARGPAAGGVARGAWRGGGRGVALADRGRTARSSPQTLPEDAPLRAPADGETEPRRGLRLNLRLRQRVRRAPLAAPGQTSRVSAGPGHLPPPEGLPRSSVFPCSAS